MESCISKDGSKCCSKRLCVCSLGLGLGVSWAVGVFILGLLAWKFHPYGGAFVHALSSVYVGYAPTFKGALIGALWALVDGFIGGVILAWIYNKCSKACCCAKCCCKKNEQK